MFELLPCPFCGSTASFTEDNSPIRDKIVWLVGCDSEDCPAMPLLCGNARKVDAAKAWNTRAASVDRAAIVREAVENVKKLVAEILQNQDLLNAVLESAEYEGEGK